MKMISYFMYLSSEDCHLLLLKTEDIE